MPKTRGQFKLPPPAGVEFYFTPPEHLRDAGYAHVRQFLEANRREIFDAMALVIVKKFTSGPAEFLDQQSAQDQTRVDAAVAEGLKGRIEKGD